LETEVNIRSRNCSSVMGVREIPTTAKSGDSRRS
jgi:hypothetical protein